MSTKFDNCSQKDGREGKIMWVALIVGISLEGGGGQMSMYFVSAPVGLHFYRQKPVSVAQKV